jgi:hypothetical protein
VAEHPASLLARVGRWLDGDGRFFDSLQEAVEYWVANEMPSTEPRDAPSSVPLTPNEAAAELIRVLELDDDATWADIVYYAAKAKSSLRMSNATISRRTGQLAVLLGLPVGPTWPQAIVHIGRNLGADEMLRWLSSEQRQAGE